MIGRGRTREWIILAVLVLGFGALGVYASDRNAEARRQQERADSAFVVAQEAIARAQAADARLVEQLAAQRAEILDSIAAIPPVQPSDVVTRFRTVIDTVEVPAEVQRVGEELVARIEELEVAVEQRDRIIALFPAQLAARDTVWLRRLEQKDRIIASLRTALDESRAEADKWEDAAGVGLWGEVKRAVFWSGVGYLLNEFTSSDGGATVVVQQPPDYGCSGCK